ncbi:phage protein [Bifidobacterium sp. DSM 109957]|uniref:Phage protein n=2 Tax=Bifidobacterium oedipodis TaxID=2675322 RepID=A0A7Y0HSD1_9BIFI|nr:phage protein [Bifidobacterium sp. DSM 109957]
MGRSMRTARRAGASMESRTADYLRWALGDDRIERRHLAGAKDRGDIAGIRFRGHRVVIECKNTAAMNVSQHLREAETERGNDDALIGVVVQKRPRIGIESREGQARQLVMMTLESFALMLNDGLPLGGEKE